jgi:predicted phage terminase large subunit-like protein
MAPYSIAAAPPVNAPPVDESDDVARQVCLDSLAMFAETFGSNYRAARFHRLLARKLEDCFRRKIRRLCISCPPRAGKSALTSILFPAWCLTKQPDLQIIQASYASDLSEGFSQHTKAVLTSDRYRQLFPPMINPNVSRVKYWQTLAGGSYFATGVGGGAVGRGANIFICDDATKNRDEANSPTHRDRVWSWFASTAMTRLSPDGVMIVIGTRWHEDDLIGRLISPERVRQFRDEGLSAEAFEVISLEAICENPMTDPLRRKMGEALWPEQWGVQRLAATKLSIGPSEWASQYQQRPAPAGGNLVDYRKIKLIDREAVPADLKLVRAWDLALSTSTQADYSCGARGGMDKAGNFYLVHMNRGKRQWPEQKRLIVQCAEAESIGGVIGIETVSAWKIAMEELKAALAGHVIVKPYTPDKDKVGRANPWLAKVDGGMFYLVRGIWNQDFLDELEQFPNGAHDDQIDAVTILWAMSQRQQVLVMA